MCAPCFDPTSGETTGACDLGIDLGPRTPAQVFANCCGPVGETRGRCVPQSFVPEGVVMPRESCADASLFCVPSEFLRDPLSAPARCSAEVRGPGICVPDCIATALGTLITAQATCSAGEQCYPCELVGGIASGACVAQ